MLSNNSRTADPIIDRDFPALFQSADLESQRAQNLYTRLVWLDLAFLIFGALVTSLAVEIKEMRVILAILGATTLGAGAFITTLLNINKYDKNWFGGRALAESVKTIAWRYMIGAGPYNCDLNPRKVDELFITEIKRILHENKSTGSGLGPSSQVSDQITNKMREIRALSTLDRKKIYLKYRIEDQQHWYTKNAEMSKNSAEKWFQWVIIIQFLALVAAIILVALPDLVFNAAGVLSTVATALIAWLQVKRYQDLSHSYSVASQELAMIHSIERHVETDEQLSRFVMDAEMAISREHTMWLARRDTL
jgi:hypothetical protein